MKFAYFCYPVPARYVREFGFSFHAVHCRFIDQHAKHATSCKLSLFEVERQLTLIPYTVDYLSRAEKPLGKQLSGFQCDKTSLYVCMKRVVLNAPYKTGTGVSSFFYLFYCFRFETDLYFKLELFIHQQQKVIGTLFSGSKSGKKPLHYHVICRATFRQVYDLFLLLSWIASTFDNWYVFALRV